MNIQPSGVSPDKDTGDIRKSVTVCMAYYKQAQFPRVPNESSMVKCHPLKDGLGL